MLSNQDLFDAYKRGDLVCDPTTIRASYLLLHVGKMFPIEDKGTMVLAVPMYMKPREEKSCTINHGGSLIIQSLERVELNASMSGLVTGHYLAIQKGLIVGSVSIEPTFKGRIMMLLHYVGEGELMLREGDPLAQLSIMGLVSPIKDGTEVYPVEYGIPELPTQYVANLGTGENVFVEEYFRQKEQEEPDDHNPYYLPSDPDNPFD